MCAPIRVYAHPRLCQSPNLDAELVFSFFSLVSFFLFFFVLARGVSRFLFFFFFFSFSYYFCLHEEHLHSIWRSKCLRFDMCPGGEPPCGFPSMGASKSPLFLHNNNNPLCACLSDKGGQYIPKTYFFLSLSLSLFQFCLHPLSPAGKKERKKITNDETKDRLLSLLLPVLHTDHSLIFPVGWCCDCDCDGHVGGRGVGLWGEFIIIFWTPNRKQQIMEHVSQLRERPYRAKKAGLFTII